MKIINKKSLALTGLILLAITIFVNGNFDLPHNLFFITRLIACSLMLWGAVLHIRERNKNSKSRKEDD